jgi:hypothetical protein
MRATVVEVTVCRKCPVRPTGSRKHEERLLSWPVAVELATFDEDEIHHPFTAGIAPNPDDPVTPRRILAGGDHFYMEGPWEAVTGGRVQPLLDRFAQTPLFDASTTLSAKQILAATPLARLAGKLVCPEIVEQSQKEVRDAAARTIVAGDRFLTLVTEPCWLASRKPPSSVRASFVPDSLSARPFWDGNARLFRADRLPEALEWSGCPEGNAREWIVIHDPEALRTNLAEHELRNRANDAVSALADELKHQPDHYITAWMALRSACIDPATTACDSLSPLLAAGYAMVEASRTTPREDIWARHKLNLLVASMDRWQDVAARRG